MLTYSPTSFVLELEKIADDGTQQKPSLLRRLAPLALGAAAGLGGYKMLRRIHLSESPGLRAIQRKAKGALSHVDELDDDRMPGMIGRLKDRFVRGVDKVIYEPASVVEARKGMTQAALKKAPVAKVEGALLPMGGPEQAASYRADLHLNMDPSVGLKLEDKVREGKLLRSLPGNVAAKSELLSAHVTPTKATPQSLDKLQSHLAEKYPSGYVIKPVDDAASGGVPTHKDRFASILSSDKKTAHQEWMQRMMEDPDKFMVQEYIPIKQSRRTMSLPPRSGGSGERSYSIGKSVPDEWRVHVAGGKVIPDTTMHRWTFDAGMSPTSRKEISDVDKFMQGAVQNMPRDVRGVPMAADVVRAEDGTFKIIELNSGGQSGFLLSPALRGKGWNYYRGITGRHSQPEALVKGLGLGAATALGTRVAVGGDKKKQSA